MPDSIQSRASQRLRFGRDLSVPERLAACKDFLKAHGRWVAVGPWGKSLIIVDE